MRRCHHPAAVPPLRRPGGDQGTHARELRPLAAPLASLPPSGTTGGPPLPTRGHGALGGFVALRRRRVNRSLLLWAGARGGRSAAPRDRPLQPTRMGLRSEFLQHMLRLGDFVWDLRNHRLEQLLRTPLSAAARVHRCFTAAEGDCSPPPPCPGGNFVASLLILNGTLESPPQEDLPLPGPAAGFLEAPVGRSLPAMDHWTQLHDRVGSPHSGRGVGARIELVVRHHARARTPAPQYAAVPLKGWGPHTRSRPTMICGAGPDHP